jgi:hypothetical protein
VDALQKAGWNTMLFIPTYTNLIRIMNRDDAPPREQCKMGLSTRNPADVITTNVTRTQQSLLTACVIY